MRGLRFPPRRPILHVREFSAGADVWFTVVVPIAGRLPLIPKQAGGDHGWRYGVYTGACDRLVQLAPVTMMRVRMVVLMPLSVYPDKHPNTLFVRFWAYNNSSSGNFSICAKSGWPVVPGVRMRRDAHVLRQDQRIVSYSLIYSGGKNTLNDSTGYTEYSALENGVNKACASD